MDKKKMFERFLSNISGPRYPLMGQLPLDDINLTEEEQKLLQREAKLFVQSYPLKERLEKNIAKDGLDVGEGVEEIMSSALEEVISSLFEKMIKATKMRIDSEKSKNQKLVKTENVGGQELQGEAVVMQQVSMEDVVTALQQDIHPIKPNSAFLYQLHEYLMMKR